MICPEHISVCFLLKKDVSTHKTFVALSAKDLYWSTVNAQKLVVLYIRIVCLFACQQYYAVLTLGSMVKNN